MMHPSKHTLTEMGISGLSGISVLDIKSQYIPEVVVVRRGAIGVWGAGEGGVGQLGGGYKRGQFTSNLRRGRAVPVTSGGSQVSGRGHKEGRKGG
jgi:hypothetical protein